MPEIIERGYLYIALPPLFKYRRGKTDRYLKDERELTEFLTEIGAENLEILDADGKNVDKDSLKRLFTKLERFKDLLNGASRRRSRPVIDFLISNADFEEVDLKSEQGAEFLKGRILAHIAQLPKVERASAAIRIEFNKEYSNYKLHCDTRFRDYPKIFELSADIFEKGGELFELRRIKQEIDGIAKAPFSYKWLEKDKSSGDDLTSKVVPTALELEEFVTQQGRKGSYIQRYKGLGEMNPEQLEVTTMSQTSRFLHRVDIEDTLEADLLFSTLMGDEVAPRKDFIQANALNVKNLDI
jgi:DNA gyrase subunit B